jgi:hypothetical protein
LSVSCCDWRSRFGGDLSGTAEDARREHHAFRYQDSHRDPLRSDLEMWQKLNVAAFLAGGVAAAFPSCIGEPYADGSGTHYHP